MLHDDLFASKHGKLLFSEFFSDEPMVVYIDSKDLDPQTCKELILTGQDFLKNGVFPMPCDNLFIIIDGAGMAVSRIDDFSFETALITMKGLAPFASIHKGELKLSGMGTMFQPAAKIREHLARVKKIEGGYQLLAKSLGRCEANVLGSVMLMTSKFTDKVKNEPIPEKLQAARKRNGKPPLRNYIKISLKPECRVAGVGHGGHVATHWRRGHVRVLPDGRKVPVRECWVNLEWADGPLVKKPYVVGA